MENQTARQKFKERVTFYMEDNGVLAYFPDIPWSRGTFMCYSHIGQHSACSPSYVNALKHATIEQYTDLLNELQSIGYHLAVI